ncbi:MAG TPA: T9SS type A sorting domain-containing protein, partial [Chitinophagales bacterium]|nr:T9SS type A sorting domain-containing protein [Chitinophagales bacterium]
SYQWQFNTADIPGATNQSYTILQTGYYTVVVSDSNGCINSFTVYVLISDIDDAIGDANISIYPNPSSGDFIVEWLNGLMVEPISIDVINALGQMVFSSSEKTYSSAFKKEIDLNDVTDGVYFIRIKTANAFIRKKIIIENSR